MSMKNTKNLKIVLGAVIIGILTITIAYAALSATLNVSVSEVTQQGGLSWKVAFTGSSASATVGGTSDTGRACGNATISETSFSVGSIEEVDRLTREFREAGFEVLSGPRTTGDGYYESCIVGFEGNQIEITV